MANFTKTIIERVNCFGDAPSTKWGAGSPYNMTWGTSKWGEGTQDLVAMLNHYIIGDAFTLAFSIVKKFTRAVNLGAQVTTMPLSPETLIDGHGYYYLFPKPTIISEDQVITGYSVVNGTTATYTTSTLDTTVWS